MAAVDPVADADEPARALGAAGVVGAFASDVPSSPPDAASDPASGAGAELGPDDAADSDSAGSDAAEPADAVGPDAAVPNDLGGFGAVNPADAVGPDAADPAGPFARADEAGSKEAGGVGGADGPSGAGVLDGPLTSPVLSGGASGSGWPAEPGSGTARRTAGPLRPVGSLLGIVTPFRFAGRSAGGAGRGTDRVPAPPQWPLAQLRPAKQPRCERVTAQGLVQPVQRRTVVVVEFGALRHR